MTAHLALLLLVPAALLTWRWSRLVSVALVVTLAAEAFYRVVVWQNPSAWEAGHLEPLRAVSMFTGAVGAIVAARNSGRRSEHERIAGAYREWMARGPSEGFTGVLGHEVAERSWSRVRRSRWLGALLFGSMGVDLTALLIHRGTDQWGPLPLFQCVALLAMCAISVWPRRV